MRPRTIVLAALLGLLLPAGAARAEEPEGAPTNEGRLTFHTRTLVLGRGDVPGVFSQAPFIQWLELAGEDLSTPGLSVHASMWGLLALDGGVDVASGSSVTGDVDLLYGQYLDPKGRFGARLGRMLIFAGPGQGFLGHVDGAWLRGAAYGLDVQAYGGRVVQPRFSNIDSYDWLTGGRIGYRRWSVVNVGASYLQARTDGAIARHFVGADLALGSFGGFDLTAYGSWDIVDRSLAESSVMARYMGIENLTLALSGHQAVPGLLIDRTSIFSVFSLGTYAEGVFTAEYVIDPQWVVGAEYARVYFPDVDGFGLGQGANRYGAHLTAYPRRDLWLRLQFDRLPTEDNGYTAGRVAARWQPADRWSGSVDLFAYFYDDPPLSTPNAGSQSLFGQLFGEYHFTPGLVLGLGGSLGQTVLASVDARALLRLTWSAEMELGGKE